MCRVCGVDGLEALKKGRNKLGAVDTFAVIRCLHLFFFLSCRYVVGKYSQVAQLFPKHSRLMLVQYWTCPGVM